MTISPVKIGNRLVGDGCPVLIIAEVGINFDNDFDKAKYLIDVAIDAGCDVVKFQTYTPDGIACKKEKLSGWEDFQRYQLPYDQHGILRDYVNKKGGIFFSTPSDKQDVDFLLKDCQVPAIKLGSDDCTNIPFLEWLALKDIPVILSTGTCNLGEVEKAVSIFQRRNSSQLILLHCVTSYPADYRYANLNAITTMKKAFNTNVGYSDHMLNNNCCFAAVALGACIIERHITYNKNAKGPDHALAADPDELKELVKGVREIEASLGDGIKMAVVQEKEMLKKFRKSIVSMVDIKQGTIITEDMVWPKRPCVGIPAGHMSIIVGRRAMVDIEKNTVLQWDMV